MSLSPTEKFDLLRLTSHSRRNSNAYLDTISNAALVAFLQFQHIKGQISSQPKTVFAIDLFLDFAVGIAIDGAGGLLVKTLVGKMAGRVTNSRIVVGKFMNTLPDVDKSNIISRYSSAVISNSFYFDKYETFLKAQRIESANISNIQYASSLVYSKVITPKLKEKLKNGGKSRRGGKLGLSETVSVVDSAMSYAVNQKVLNDIVFDELENSISSDVIKNFDDTLGILKNLQKLHQPLSHKGIDISLDKAREQMILYFEFILWAITFAQKYGARYKKGFQITREGTDNDTRLVLFDDIGKDITLTKYLVNRLDEDSHLYKYNEKIYSRATKLRQRLRTAGEKSQERKADFGNFELK